MEKKEREETISIPGEWPLNAYTFKADKVMDRYLEGLKNKRVLGVKCPGCGIIYVPPKPYCGRCHTKLMIDRTEYWVEVSDKGTVQAFSIAEDSTVIAVQLDGADTNFPTVLGEAKPEDVKVGMRVQAVWVDEPVGRIDDMAYFKPIEE